MKTILPPHSHTATTTIYQQTDGKLVALIDLEIMVPSRVPAMLRDNGQVHCIPCAGIGEERLIRGRALGWKRKMTLYKREPLNLVKCLERASAENCDTAIQLQISPTEWHLVGVLCGRLGITPGQWYLACAAYNAEVEESRLDEYLDTLPDTDEITPSPAEPIP